MLVILSIVFILALLLIAGGFFWYFKNTAKKSESAIANLKAKLLYAEEQKKKLERSLNKTSSSTSQLLSEKDKIEHSIKVLQGEKASMEGEKRKFEEKNKKMWQMSVAIHREKEKINKLKMEIEERHQSIIDSVNYAKRIQEAILPPRSEIFKYLPESFVLFKPRDIVSGDFYWFRHLPQENKVIIAAVDCTGHGVPGAFMSMIGNTLLNEIVSLQGVIEPAAILNNLNEAVRSSLKQDQLDSESRDGMDVAICCIDFDKMEVQYSGANRPLYLLRGDMENTPVEETTEASDSLLLGVTDIEFIEEFKANKFPIGGLAMEEEKLFTNHLIPVKKGDTIYLFTDGYADQFGGDHGRKLMTKKFKKILRAIQNKPLPEQETYLGNFIDEWRGEQEQVDDVLVIGIRM
jgi:serine phosphatase RsbU (regulator of sigma subunit)